MREFGRQRRARRVRASPRLFALLILVSWLCPPSLARAGDVAVLMSANVGAYKEALKGFEKSGPHKIVAKYNMDGDFDRGRKLLAKIETKVQPDLILAVGVWALKVVAENPPQRPVVFAMVLNPPSITGSRNLEVTGASINVSSAENLRSLKELGPQIRRIGLVYSREKTAYLMEQARVDARSVGVELVAKEVTKAGDVAPALEALRKEGIDAFWILPDDAILAPAVIKHVFLFSYRNKIPILGLSERQAKMGRDEFSVYVELIQQ